MIKRFVLVLSLLAAPAAFADDGEIATEALPAPQAARTMLMPAGFSAKVFAAEPDVKQPISFCIDDRGRVWVAEAYNFPFRDREPQDRILILEDTDGDGRADKRKVFYDKLGYVTGIEVGFGGVWVISPPEMLFIPDKDGDDKPDGPPQVLLDGFGNQPSAHNIANGFTWGPDGWLYAGHGRTSPSDVGPPGAPPEERIHFDGGVYRYHPVRHKFEGFCDGTTNPWGVDFDDYGQAFISNCVNPHLFHAMQGAHYEPWRGRTSSLHAYERIPTIADHLHWVGSIDGSRGGKPEQLDVGGGHAHCGTMIYLGDNWPEGYRNTAFMCNVHGRRINNDLLQRKGSGYTASHAADVMVARDPWFKGVTLQYGPDGSVFVSDWSDTGECHDYRNTQRQTGRIYKITYGEVEPPKVNIAAQSNEHLVQLQLHKNDWFVRHARRILQERAAAGQDMGEVHASLHKIFETNKDVTRKLRALWALWVTGGADNEFLHQQLRHDSEYVRAWAIRLLNENELPAQSLETFVALARDDPSPFVRMHLACAMRRLPAEQCWPIAERLARRSEDARDANLPLLVWYAVEPLVAADTARALRLLDTGCIAKLRPFIARRAASGTDAAGRLELLSASLAQEQDAEIQLDVLLGMHEALRGRKDLETPKSWPAALARLQASSQQRVGPLAVRVGLMLGDPASADALRRIAEDTNESTESRQAALQDLLDQKDSRLPLLLFKLLDSNDFRKFALRGLAGYDHADTPGEVLRRYAKFTFAERQDALATLSSRPRFAMRLLEAVTANQISRSDFSVATVRQLQQFDDDLITGMLREIWGVIGSDSKDKNFASQVKQYRRMLSSDSLSKADLPHGRALFARACAACHKLFGEGGDVGPEITGANRTNVEYLLENILDPSGLVPKDYQLTIFETTDGRVLSGLIVERTDTTVTVATANDRILLAKDDIEAANPTDKSMMPDGLLKDLKESDIRDLFGYLASPKQVPLGKDTGG